MNNVSFIGRIVADPESKFTPSGVAVCNFRIAVERRFKNESGEKESDFFDIIAWRKTAEFVANYLGKGRLVAVSGRAQQRSWVQQDGQKRYKIEFVAEEVQGLDKPKGGGQSQPSAGVGDFPDDDYDPFAEE